MPTLASRVAMRSSNPGVVATTSVTASDASGVTGGLASALTRIAGQRLCYNRRMSFPEALRALVGDGAAVWGFLMAIGIVLALTPLIARLAPRIGGVDAGGDRPRVHQGAIPRIGGLAIVVAILVPAAIFIHLEGPYLGILAGTLLVAGLGLVDDIRGLRPEHEVHGRLRGRADPRPGLRRPLRPSDAAVPRRLRPRLGRVSR